MAQINEKLIQEVFAEMIKYKPSLVKHTIVDDEEEEEVDYRILGDLIIRNMPWPIGIELRRLFSGSMRQLDRLRLDQIFKTIERSMQFICFIMISQIVKEQKNGSIQVSDGFKKEFANRFSVFSLGNFASLIRMMGTMMKEQKREWFMSEMNEIFNDKLYAAFDFWVPERNEIGHYQINLTQEDIEKRCVEYEDKLSLILQKIAFFSKYKLISVKEIKVFKSKSQNASFHHTIELLNSSDSDFKAQELDETKFTENNSVLLMKSIKSIDDYLNLSPLVIDTSSEVIDNKDKFNLKKDIFMFSKFRGDHLMYAGTEVTEKCDLRSLRNYDILLNEFKEILATLS